MEPMSGVARDALDQPKHKTRRETRYEEAGPVAGLKIEARKLVPASSCAMALLHAPRVGETTERCCPICHDDFEEGDKLRTMPCAHAFHERCIFRSLRVHHLCPVCDCKLPTKEEAVVLEACVRAGSELFRFIRIAGSQISRSFVI